MMMSWTYQWLFAVSLFTDNITNTIFNQPPGLFVKKLKYCQNSLIVDPLLTCLRSAPIFCQDPGTYQKNPHGTTLT